MRVFLSHSSYQKPLVREVKSYLPQFLTSWLDEEKLLFGDHISATIESAIKIDTDYVLLFVDDHAVSSAWVKRELQWALQLEQRLGRTIVLPVIIEAPALEKLAVRELSDRKHLRLQDFQEASVRALGKAISEALFALICRDVHRLHNPGVKSTISAITSAVALLKKHGTIIQRVIFPHRKANPLPRPDLLRVMNEVNDPQIDEAELDSILLSLLQRNLVPGLIYDGSDAYLSEEHAQWKSEMHREKKERVAKHAVNSIQNGMKVLLDAGSTVEEVVRLLCKRIETRMLTHITIASTSVNIADMISDCCVKMGFDDGFTAVSLFIPGGRIRPGTQAIVPLEGTKGPILSSVLEKVGMFDLGFVGVNGIDADAGLTTYENAETYNKYEILASAKTCLVLGDSSKVGIKLDHRFAGFDDGLTLIVDEDKGNTRLDELISRHGNRIVLAR